MGNRSIFFRSLKKRRILFLLTFCFAIIFLLNTIKKDYLKNIREKAIEQNLKIENFLQNCFSALSTLKYFYVCDINKKIHELHKQNIKLRCEIENLKHIRCENDELRALLRLKSSDLETSYRVIVAKVIGVFSNDYLKSYIINVGSLNGVNNTDIVRNADGFIGRICDVHEKWSCVLLITDTNSKIPVKIREYDRNNLNGKEKEGGTQQKIREPINAILSGDNSNYLKVSMKNEDAQIKEGDIAETAYFENSACNGIPVGKVVKSGGEFIIKPFVNFEQIQNVCVVKNTISSDVAYAAAQQR